MFKIIIAFCASDAGTDCKLMAVTRDFKTEFECVTTMSDYFKSGGPDEAARLYGKPYVSGVCLSEDDIKEYKLVIADK